MKTPQAHFLDKIETIEFEALTAMQPFGHHDRFFDDRGSPLHTWYLSNGRDDSFVEPLIMPDDFKGGRSGNGQYALLERAKDFHIGCGNGYRCQHPKCHTEHGQKGPEGLLERMGTYQCSGER